MTLRAGLFPIAIAACAGPPVPSSAPSHDRCGGEIIDEPILDSPHEPIGAPILWDSNPPTSGPHWPDWAAWDRHYDHLARGFWLHNAEHGGIVFTFRCDAGCPELAAQLDDIVRAQHDDPHCDPPLRHRSLVVADPLLPADHTVAAIAWGVYYTAPCADPEALTAFYVENTGRATENTCAEGSYTEGAPLYPAP